MVLGGMDALASRARFSYSRSGLNSRPQDSFLCASLLSLALIWPGMAQSQQTLVVDSNNNQGWKVASWSNPIPESVVGIADGVGGAASLDFSLAGTIEDPAAIAVPSGKPDAPYDLTATPGIGSATISFTAGSDHGYEITNYLYSTDGVDYVPLSPADAASPVTITGLTSNEGVSITLKAQNSKGDSPASEAVVVIPRAAPKPVLPVPIPLWLLVALVGSVGWLGYRRLRLA